jgi:nucleotide-binding universal stress UspA family protein
LTIAVAHDDSAEGRAALVHAAREARFLHTSLAVLHVLDGYFAGGSGQSNPEQHSAAVGRLVEQTLRDEGLEAVSWDLHIATDEEGRAGALVVLTEQVSADLLVVGSRRRTPIGKFLLGSTVQRVVLDSPVPVLVVKAPDRG